MKDLTPLPERFDPTPWAMGEIEQVEEALVDLYNSTTSESEKEKAEQLLNEIREFKIAHR